MVRIKSTFTGLLSPGSRVRKLIGMKRNLYTLITLLALFLIAGCSPKASYRALTFFFDGVPKPAVLLSAADSASAKSMALASLSPVPVMPVFEQHNPYRNRDCQQCHDDQNYSKLSKTEPDLCYKCHQNFREVFAWVHGPVDGGYCSDCHDPHKSLNTYLLKRQGNAVCTLCHLESEVKKNPVHANASESECMKCHDPHGGANRFVLKQ